jgi:uncharacterized protein (DUF433 family)
MIGVNRRGRLIRTTVGEFDRMATIETRYEHIVLQDGQVPQIAGTTMKVVELVTAQQAHGWSPEELAFQFPDLTLGQVHSALAYYWDHQEALDREIARRLELADDLQRRGPLAPVLARLRARRMG